MDKEIFLVEELENRLAIEAAQYMYKVEELWETNKFEPTYFDTYIAGPLYGEFIQSIYDRIKPLNSHEANRFLTLSVAQFKTHTPVRREKDFILNYWHTKWYPNLMGDDVSEHDEKYAKHVWRHYTSHFHLYKEAAEKGLSDLKAGFLGSQPAQHITIPTIHNKIVYSSFDAFLNCLKYNYPYKNTVWSFKHEMIEALDLFKKEIYTNLIALNKDEKKAYLNRLKYDLANHQQHVWSSAETLEKWYKKYDSSQENDIFFNSSDNIIYQILNSDKPTSREENNEAFNEDTEQIQDEFYNFYYGFYLDNAITFIVEQINELNPSLSLSANASQTQQILATAIPKLKTDLSVPQLALLFKMLNDLKPNIFEVKSEAELLRFISANFETKKSKEDGISTDKLRILFNQPDSKAADFWEKHFYTLIAEIKKFK